MAEARAEIVGNIWKLTAQEGDEVGVGDVLAIMESMKMEIPVVSPAVGFVTHLPVTVGQIVQEGDLIAIVE